MDDLTTAMLEYASAIRGDWNDFDGRTERAVIEGWVAELRNPSGITLKEWRERLGICLVGGGHWCGSWWGHCSARTGDEDSDYGGCGCPCAKGAD